MNVAELIKLVLWQAAEIERLRARTHEIQAEESQRNAELQSLCARYQNALRTAREETLDYRADWASDPPAQEPGGLWRYASQRTCEALTYFALERQTERELSDLLAAALCEWEAETGKPDEEGARWCLSIGPEAQAALAAWRERREQEAEQRARAKRAAAQSAAERELWRAGQKRADAERALAESKAAHERAERALRAAESREAEAESAAAQATADERKEAQ